MTLKLSVLDARVRSLEQFTSAASQCASGRKNRASLLPLVTCMNVFTAELHLREYPHLTSEVMATNPDCDILLSHSSWWQNCENNLYFIYILLQSRKKNWLDKHSEALREKFHQETCAVLRLHRLRTSWSKPHFTPQIVSHLLHTHSVFPVRVSRSGVFPL